MSDGWIKLHRKLMRWGWYTDSKMVHLFIHLLLKANHKPRDWKGIRVETGQVITGRESLSRETGISIQSIRTCIKRLKSTGEITIKSTNSYSLITIVNYREYQIQNREPNQEINQDTNHQLTINQPQTRIKELKKTTTKETPSAVFKQEIGKLREEVENCDLAE